MLDQFGRNPAVLFMAKLAGALVLQCLVSAENACVHIVCGYKFLSGENVCLVLRKERIDSICALRKIRVVSVVHSRRKIELVPSCRFATFVLESQIVNLLVVNLGVKRLQKQNWLSVHRQR